MRLETNKANDAHSIAASSKSGGEMSKTGICLSRCRCLFVIVVGGNIGPTYTACVPDDNQNRQTKILTEFFPVTTTITRSVTYMRTWERTHSLSYLIFSQFTVAVGCR